MNGTYTKIDNVTVKTTDHISVKDILEGLRKISVKQKAVIEQKVAEQITEQKKMLRKEKSCIVCSDIVIEMKNRSQKVADDANAIIEMYRSRTDKIKMKDGITYTLFDLGGRIEFNRSTIERDWDRYIRCCKEGKLPENSNKKR